MDALFFKTENMGSFLYQSDYPNGFMVQSHWLSQGWGQGPGSRHEQMGSTVLCRTFQTAPEQVQGPTLLYPIGLVPVPAPVPDIPSVITPLCGNLTCEFTAFCP